MGGLINPRPWRGRCRAGYSNNGGPPLASKRPVKKEHQVEISIENNINCKLINAFEDN